MQMKPKRARAVFSDGCSDNMNVSQKAIAIILLYSAAIGVFLGVVYDFFRIRRKAYDLRKKRTGGKISGLEYIRVFFEDILFSLIASVVFVIFIFHMNSGRVRGIAFLGALFGFFVYRATLGRLVMFLSEAIIKLICRIFGWIFGHVFRPLFGILKKLFVSPLIKIYDKLDSVLYMKRNSSFGVGGLNITDKKIKGALKKYEDAYKHIRAGGGIGVHRLLHSDNSKNAVRVQRAEGRQGRGRKADKAVSTEGRSARRTARAEIRH